MPGVAGQLMLASCYSSLPLNRALREGVHVVGVGGRGVGVQASGPGVDNILGSAGMPSDCRSSFFFSSCTGMFVGDE